MDSISPQTNNNNNTTIKRLKTMPEPQAQAQAQAQAQRHRDWSLFPDDLLISVVNRLSASHHLAAFAAVCTAWRPLAKSVPCPPLLLHCPLTLPFSSAPVAFRSLSSPIQTNNSSSTINSPLAVNSVKHRNCVGYSHSHLIFAARTAFLVDVFSGAEIPSPTIPSDFSRYDLALLTAHPSHPSSALLILDFRLRHVLSWPLAAGAGAQFSVFSLDDDVRSLCVFDGKVYGLLSAGRVFTLETTTEQRRMLDVSLPDAAQNLHIKNRRTSAPVIEKTNGQHLVECDGRLLLLLFVGSPPDEDGSATVTTWIKVYRLDFERMVWAETESIGDWCLFMDAVGRCHAACPEPERWGGKSNCVYVAGGVDAWHVLPLDQPFGAFFLSPAKWPSPVWVYPSMLA